MIITGITAPLERALDYHLARHNLLSANLAHVDTPGYRAKELYRDPPAPDFKQVMAVTMEATNAKHITSSGVRPVDWKVEVDPNAPVRADGNGVDLDREAVKIAANNLRYDAIATLVQGELNMVDYAAKDGR
ncbi:MAG: flagellar basal body rod protein FlgB [Myxococcales bacterium]|nr:flagellar basal body rod protein FlgB [Myxococcales bacterium]